jgi:hypothetical protein
LSTSAQIPEQQLPPVEPEAPEPEAQTFGEKNRDLPECLRKALDDIVRKIQAREIYDRRIEVLKDRMHRFYEDGIQHVYPNYGTGAYQIGSPGAQVSIGDTQIQCPDYIGAYNIFYPYGRSLDAVLTQNPPGIDFVPDDPSRSEDMEAAETAEAYRHCFDQANDVKIIQQKISRMFRLSGRTVVWVKSSTNPEKWGYNEQGTPRQMETAQVFGTIESKVPILAKSQSDCPYVILYDDPDVLMCKQEYPWIATKIKGGQAGIGENEWERFARLGVLQARKGYFLTGNAGANITTRINAFLRPAVFDAEAYKDPYLPTYEEDESFDAEQNIDDDGNPLTIAGKLQQLFPEGCHVTYVGETYAESENVSQDDAVTIGFPRERDGMSGGALMQDMVVVQDEFNDLKNAERSAYEKGWPSLWVSADDTEYDAIISQRAEPFAIRQKKSDGQNQPLEQMFFREPDMQLPTSFVNCMTELRGPLAQFITGSLPALQGETDPDNKTASGKAMDRAQAMGMLGMPWANMQRLFARIYYMAALLAAKNPDHSEEIVVPNGSNGNLTLRLERLTKGKFKARPDQDSSFPETTAAKRQLMQQIITVVATAPAIGAEFLKSPDNWKTMLTLNGFPELKLIPAMAYEKQTREIEILLRESPVPDEQALKAAMVQHAAGSLTAEATGAPDMSAEPNPAAFMKASVPALKDDYHQWEAEKCQEWLSSNDCWRELVNGNEQGVENVRLHKAQHDAYLAQQAMAMAAMQPQAQAGAVPKQHTAPHAPEGNKEVGKKSAAPGSPGQPTV